MTAHLCLFISQLMLNSRLISVKVTTFCNNRILEWIFIFGHCLKQSVLTQQYKCGLAKALFLFRLSLSDLPLTHIVSSWVNYKPSISFQPLSFKGPVKFMCSDLMLTQVSGCFGYGSCHSCSQMSFLWECHCRHADHKTVDIRTFRWCFQQVIGWWS